ncbi:hypothetical protein EVAR_35603_1 [Eumeta japonica]|uniref:Uncharacterized protein n=1 Tax=Eumeta variegata TaxID=151549 RepID=A0A4C1WES5_EUMVA|nr:hypothetical protein EVAR_35603_1 [Eumeta japonica]
MHECDVRLAPRTKKTLIGDQFRCPHGNTPHLFIRTRINWPRVERGTGSIISSHKLTPITVNFLFTSFEAPLGACERADASVYAVKAFKQKSLGGVGLDHAARGNTVGKAIEPRNADIHVYLPPRTPGPYVKQCDLARSGHCSSAPGTGLYPNQVHRTIEHHATGNSHAAGKYNQQGVEAT